MERKYKVYTRTLTGQLLPVLHTADYAEACRKEQDLLDHGHAVFVWEV